MNSLSTALLLVFTLLINTTVLAQNQVFSLGPQNNQKMAVSIADGALVIQKITEDGAKASQKFLLKRLTNGNILIASAANPLLCLKHTGTTVELSELNKNDSEDFEWKIEYLDEDQYLFKHASLTDHCLSVAANNQLTISPIAVISRKKHRACCQFMLVAEDNPF